MYYMQSKGIIRLVRLFRLGVLYVGREYFLFQSSMYARASKARFFVANHF